MDELHVCKCQPPPRGPLSRSRRGRRGQTGRQHQEGKHQVVVSQLEGLL